MFQLAFATPTSHLDSAGRISRGGCALTLRCMMQNKTRFDSTFEGGGGPDIAKPLAVDGNHDAHGLQRALDARLSPGNADAPATGGDAAADVAQSKPSRTLLRFVKAAAGIAIVAVFGWLPLRALFQTSSVEAVVNSRLVTLRSPIDGKISAGASLSGDLGTVGEGTFILRVVNPRGDRVRLDDLRSQMSRLENERPSLVSKIASAQAGQKDLARQAALFTAGRIRQLEARIAEIQTSIEAAAARREEAAAAVERASSLIKSGSVSSRAWAPDAGSNHCSADRNRRATPSGCNPGRAHRRARGHFPRRQLQRSSELGAA
ncbi:hypothetical protein ACVWXL_006551 [Bradyrhizobium sp. GM22.5]